MLVFLLVHKDYGLDWRNAEIMFDTVDDAMPQPGPDDGSGAGSQKPTRVRVEFPETWLWSDSTTGYPSGTLC